MPKVAQSRKKHQSNVVRFPDCRNQVTPIRRAMHAITEEVPGCHPNQIPSGGYLFEDDEGKFLFMLIPWR